jgi:hypothetical protein
LEALNQGSHVFVFGDFIASAVAQAGYLWVRRIPFRGYFSKRVRQSLINFGDSDNGSRNGRAAMPDFESAERGYSWPASRLTFDDMEKLAMLNAATGLPMTKLIHEAVGLLYELTKDKLHPVYRRSQGKIRMQLCELLADVLDIQQLDICAEEP